MRNAFPRIRLVTIVSSRIQRAMATEKARIQTLTFDVEAITWQYRRHLVKSECTTLVTCPKHKTHNGGDLMFQVATGGKESLLAYMGVFVG